MLLEHQGRRTIRRHSDEARPVRQRGTAASAATGAARALTATTDSDGSIRRQQEREWEPDEQSAAGNELVGLCERRDEQLRAGRRFYQGQAPLTQRPRCIMYQGT